MGDSSMVQCYSSMLALASDNFRLTVVDVTTQRVVRLFTGHTNTVTDMVCLHSTPQCTTPGLSHPSCCCDL